jgi:hypothetical protein
MWQAHDGHRALASVHRGALAMAAVCCGLAGSLGSLDGYGPNTELSLRSA